MRWCCKVFRSTYDAAGSRGITVQLCRSDDGIARAELQFSAIDSENKGRLPSIPFPVAVSTSVFIAYCPWCGVSIETYYRDEVLPRCELAPTANE